MANGSKSSRRAAAMDMVSGPRTSSFKKRKDAARAIEDSPPLEYGPPPIRDPNAALGKATAGDFPLRTSITPMDWLKDVYSQAPGGAEAAFDIGEQHGLSKEARERAKLPVDVLSLPGEFGGLTTDEGKRIEVSGKTAESRADTLAHELTHATQWAEKDDDSLFLIKYRAEADKLRRLANIRVGEKIYTPKSDNPAAFRNYITSRPEVRAENLRKIKHWGAVRGILPKDEKEARRLINTYFHAVQPGLHASDPKNDRELYDPMVWQELLEQPGTAKELLQTVKSEKRFEQTAKQRFDRKRAT